MKRIDIDKCYPNVYYIIVISWRLIFIVINAFV